MAAEKKSSTGVSPSVFSRDLEFELREELDMVDITADVDKVLRDSGITEGSVTVFVPGATGVITCLEFEPGVIQDFKAAIERLMPRDGDYQHNVFQGDGNGHAHVRAGMIGPSLAVPVVQGEMTLGVWQQIVLVNCDNQSRLRRVVVQVMGA
jgi:secondary thiamine-phosphate synthase enzyme